MWHENKRWTEFICVRVLTRQRVNAARGVAIPTATATGRRQWQRRRRRRGRWRRRVGARRRGAALRRRRHLPPQPAGARPQRRLPETAQVKLQPPPPHFLFISLFVFYYHDENFLVSIIIQYHSPFLFDYSSSFIVIFINTVTCIYSYYYDH